MLSSVEIRALINTGMMHHVSVPEILQTATLMDYLTREWLKQQECEGGALDLTVSHFLQQTRDVTPVIGPDERIEPKVYPLRWDMVDDMPTITLQPDEYVLFKTREVFEVPAHVAPTLHQKRTLPGDGAMVIFALIHPGFRGQLTCGLKVIGPLPITIKYGARLLTSRYEWIDGDDTTQYNGPHQDGKGNEGIAITPY